MRKKHFLLSTLVMFGLAAMARTTGIKNEITKNNFTVGGPTGNPIYFPKRHDKMTWAAQRRSAKKRRKAR